MNISQAMKNLDNAMAKWDNKYSFIRALDVLGEAI
jgi:hypothetical protein